MAKTRKLTDSQEREALRRYYLYRDNKPWVIAQDFGISTSTLNEVVKRQRKAEHAIRQ